MTDHVPFGLHVTGIVNDDRNDRRASLDRQMKSAFLEFGEPGRQRSRAFGRQAYRLSLDTHRIHERIQSINRTGGILSVDQDNARIFHDSAQDRNIPNLTLAYSANVATHQSRNDNQIDIALMVEYEYRRSMRPQVLLASYPEVQSDQSAGRIGEQRYRKIQRIASGAG